MYVAYPKEILNKLKWRPGSDLRDAEIHYLHRGAPNDTRTIKGSDILELERSFFVTADGTIPYHRIRKIVCKGETLYDSKYSAPESEADSGNRENMK